jgi:hypothetical protein
VQVGIFALGLGWLIVFARQGGQACLDPLLALLAAATLWGVAQLALDSTVYPWATKGAVLDWFTRLTVFFLALQAYDSDRKRQGFLRGLLWFGFIVAIQTSLQKFTSPQKILWLFPTELKGVMGTFVYHNQYAAFIETVLPLALTRAILERDRAWLYGAMAAVMMASVIAGESRAGAFILLVETVSVAALWRWRIRLPWRRLAPAAAITALLVVAFAAAMGWGPLWQKLQRTDPWGERRQLTMSSLEMAMARPWMGFGLGTWATAYPAFARFDDGRFENQAHNDWAQWAAEGGLPFLMLMLASGGLLVRPALKTIWGVGLLAVLTHCLVDYHFQQRPAFGYYYFALAAAATRAAAADGALKSARDARQ